MKKIKDTQQQGKTTKLQLHGAYGTFPEDRRYCDDVGYTKEVANINPFAGYTCTTSITIDGEKSVTVVEYDAKGNLI
jgi:hypothetical protein